MGKRLLNAKEKEILETAYQKGYKLDDFRSLAESMNREVQRLENWFKRRRLIDQDRRHKRQFTELQRAKLEALYQENQRQGLIGYKRIAKEMDIEDEIRVKYWYKRRRAIHNTTNPVLRLNRERKRQLLLFNVKNSPQEKEIIQIAENVGATTTQIENLFSSKRTLVNTCDSSGTKVETILSAYQESIQQGKLSSKNADLNPEEKEVLEAAYEKNPVPTGVELEKIRDTIHVDLDRIKIWFDRKRDAMIYLNTLLEAERKEALEEAYQKNKYLTPNEVGEIGHRLGMSIDKSRSWISNRRYKDPDYNRDTMIATGATLFRGSTAQKIALIEAYENNKYLTSKEIGALAKRLDMPVSYVRNWFQYQRSQDQDFVKDNLVVVQPKKKNFMQEIALNEAYQMNSYPKAVEVEEIADRTNLKKSEVQNWFVRKRQSNSDHTFWFNTTQRQLLEAAFKKNPNPFAEERENIAKELGVALFQVSDWYARARFVSGYRNDVEWLTAQQSGILMDSYRNNSYPDKKTIAELASCIDIGKLRVRSWFTTIRERAENLEMSDMSQMKKEQIQAVEVKAEPMDLKLENEDIVLSM